MMDFNSENEGLMDEGDDLIGDHNEEASDEEVSTNDEDKEAMIEFEEGECVTEEDENDEVVIRKPNADKGGAQSEEQEMQKFMDFIKKQSLVIVDVNQLSGEVQGKTKVGHQANEMERASMLKGPRVNQQQKGKKEDNINDNLDDQSEVTVYQNAMEKMSSKRGSSSSEDHLDTSDELDWVAINELTLKNDEIVNAFISEARQQANLTKANDN